MLKTILSSTGDFCLTFLNLLYPQDCLVCSGRARELKPTPLCEPCSDRIMAYVGSPHWATAERELAFDAAYHVASYEDIVKRCICLFKYEGKTRLSKVLGSVMVEYAARNLNFGSVDMIVPVPLHPVKLRERQFNQSELIAEHLAKKFNKKIEKDWLKRIRYTAPQAGLSREQRLRNIKGAFLVKRDAGFAGKSILLVDDVMTTGATLHECAKTIKSAGAKKVLAYTLACGN
ncbi:MAG: ComF family protein [Candidatus Omnitrophica bacterium]|nr:ComF family protein [Candidatus Omnitrophota bacterium]MDD5311331.1 ComF family protein [Candidatus Omnitrophota bacterium]